jgi:phosphatidylinositol glycan class N
LSLHFFFLVRNDGSWKEIGQSISHFGITNFIIVVLQLLFLATRPFVANARR